MLHVQGGKGKAKLIAELHVASVVHCRPRRHAEVCIGARNATLA
jgi:hypothetical protein